MSNDNAIAIADESKKIKKVNRLAMFSSYTCLTMFLLLVLGKYNSYGDFVKAYPWHSPLVMVALVLTVIVLASLNGYLKVQKINPPKIKTTPLVLFLIEFIYGISAYILIGIAIMVIYGVYLGV